MKRLTKYPDWIFKMFASLCFSQVKEQLHDNIIYCHPNSPSFICNGHLYAFVHNRSLVIDEPATN